MEETNKRQGFSLRIEVPVEVVQEFVRENFNAFFDYIEDSGCYWVDSFLRDHEKELGEFVCSWNKEG
jgi:hypothetical protein